MEGYGMSIKELLDRIVDTHSIEDVLYIIGKDERWLLSRIVDEVLKHKDEFITGDDYYMELNDE